MDQEIAEQFDSVQNAEVDVFCYDNRSDNVTTRLLLPGLPQNSTATQRNEELAKIEIAVQAVVFFLAVFGNGCVLLALFIRKKKTSRMHYFIMHLSLSDLLVAFCNILSQMIWDVTFRFQGGDFLCRFVKYIQVVVMFLSTYVLVMTAIDRYNAICRPLSNYHWTPRRVHIMIGVAWAVSLSFSAPQLFIFKWQEVRPGSGVYDCLDTFQEEWTIKAYITFSAFSIYIVPLGILMFCYGRICCDVWINAKTKQNCTRSPQDGGTVYKFNGSGTVTVLPRHNSHFKGSTSIRESDPPRSHAAHRAFSRAKMKTVKLTFVVIVAYVLCWSPFFIAQLWWAYDSKAPINSATFVICLLLGSLNSCCNPWIYMAFSGNLIQQLLKCKRTPKKKKNLTPRKTPEESIGGGGIDQNIELNKMHDCEKDNNKPANPHGVLRRADSASLTYFTKMTTSSKLDSCSSGLKNSTKSRTSSCSRDSPRLRVRACDYEVLPRIVLPPPSRIRNNLKVNCTENDTNLKCLSDIEERSIENISTQADLGQEKSTTSPSRKDSTDRNANVDSSGKLHVNDPKTFRFLHESQDTLRDDDDISKPLPR